MKVPFFDFNQAPSVLVEEWQEAVGRVLRSGRYIGGQELEIFESDWASYININYAVGVGNGLDAIILGLRALNIGPGSTVAVPSHTFLATWIAVEAVGATPLGIDCDEFGLLDLDILEGFGSRIDAVIPVHMHGQAVDMRRLCKWAEEQEVKIIEDCAQAHGLTIEGRHVGTWGDIGAFSFYPTKNLGALGDAGVVVTSKEFLAKRIRSLGNYGSEAGNKYKYAEIGVNSRLDPIQAAVLRVNLSYLDDWNLRRREIAKHYINGFKNVDLQLLNEDPSSSVWHHFITLCGWRDEFRVALEGKGVFTEVHYPQCAEDSYAHIKGMGSNIPIRARKLAESTLSLPISPWMQDEQVQFVVDSVREIILLRKAKGDIT